MNKKTLMVMANRDKPRRRRMGVEYEDWALEDRYTKEEPYRVSRPTESKFRDRRGREHYDDGRYAPQSMAEPEYRVNMDDMPSPHSEYHEPWMERPITPTYDDRRLIGFARSDASVPRYREMDRMYGTASSGHAESREQPRFDRDMAYEWTSGMVNADGSRGPHWTMEQAKQIMEQCNIKADPLKFWVALNAVYSDIGPVLKRHGITSVDAYADIAKAFWLEDADSVDDKEAAYFAHVVKHR